MVKVRSGVERVLLAIPGRMINPRKELPRVYPFILHRSTQVLIKRSRNPRDGINRKLLKNLFSLLSQDIKPPFDRILEDPITIAPFLKKYRT